MKYKGSNYSRAYHLSYRIASDGDIDAEGKLLKAGVDIAIIPISKCRIEEREGKRYYIGNSCPAGKNIPVSLHGSANGSGRFRLNNTGAWQRYYHNPTEEGVFDTIEVYTLQYVTLPLYLVKDGKVYSGTRRYVVPPIAYFLQRDELDRKESHAMIDWLKNSLVNQGTLPHFFDLNVNLTEYLEEITPYVVSTYTVWSSGQTHFY